MFASTPRVPVSQGWEWEIGILVSHPGFSFRHASSLVVVLDCFHFLPTCHSASCLADFNNRLTAFPTMTAPDIIFGDFNVCVVGWSPNQLAYLNHLRMLLKMTCAQARPQPQKY